MGHVHWLIQWLIISVGFPAVFLYHAFVWNVFFNVAAEDAVALEKIGNYLLAPVNYICVGKKAIPTGDERLPYRIVQRFDYNEYFVVKTAAAALAAPLAAPLGVFCKAFAYLYPETIDRHEKIDRSIHAPVVISNLPYYEKIGLTINNLAHAVKIDPPLHKRRAGEENHLSEEKKALSLIMELLEKHQIPYWMDCGTCLGAYRYGGIIPWDFDIDISIFSKDHVNVWHALQELDQKLYQVQDWSSRYSGEGYLKVYVRSTGCLIDIFHYDIDESAKKVYQVVANKDSRFLSKEWKEHESTYAKPIDFDLLVPFKIADFDGLKVPVPGKIKEFLQSKYGENIDPVRIFDEKSNQYVKDLTHPYWQNVNVY